MQDLSNNNVEVHDFWISYVEQSPFWEADNCSGSKESFQLL